MLLRLWTDGRFSCSCVPPGAHKCSFEGPWALPCPFACTSAVGPPFHLLRAGHGLVYATAAPGAAAIREFSVGRTNGGGAGGLVRPALVRCGLLGCCGAMAPRLVEILLGALGPPANRGRGAAERGSQGHTLISSIQTSDFLPPMISKGGRGAGGAFW